MKIDLTEEDVRKFALMYEFVEDDKKLSKRLLAARRRGYMTKADLVGVAIWKSNRPITQRHVQENTIEEIRDISHASFSAITNRLRIGVLMSLRGVQWPMASVILHFAFPNEYPILEHFRLNIEHLRFPTTFCKAT